MSLSKKTGRFLDKDISLGLNLQFNGEFFSVEMFHRNDDLREEQDPIRFHQMNTQH